MHTEYWRHCSARRMRARRPRSQAQATDYSGGLMSYKIEKVAVLGAGVMGAQIAAHLVNAGLKVLLLDIVPPDLAGKEAPKAAKGTGSASSKEWGLKVSEAGPRNSIVVQGVTAARKLKP